LTQISRGEDRYRIEIALEGEGMPRQTAVCEFDFALSAQNREDLRWYLEDYLQYPQDPAPKIAARIENRMAELGTELFKAVFQANDDARDIWAVLRSQLNDTRVEIATGVEGATAIPWELIRDLKTDVPLALRARSFVRSYSQAAQRPKLPGAATGPIRILLVICRPGARDDVPFRSVASRIVKGLSDEARAHFQLDVLRPPTFEQLGRTLRAAKDKGEPYHVVHFDGHGTYADVEASDELGDLVSGLSSLVLAGSGRPGPHGYLLFENPAVKENVQLVGGPLLGKLLVETDVPVLVLNACRSAHAESSNAPDSADGSREAEEADSHSRVRAFGSLAQEVMDAGVVGVVAMRYNVYVVTAAQFVADLYATLTQGHTLDEAATLGRKVLHDQPLREIAYDPRPLQDWPVPVVYCAASMPLFPKPKTEEMLKIEIGRADAMPEPKRGMVDPTLPTKPDFGFFGRDETLLALDRTFDTQSIVLLHAYAGNGKTATAAEFGRWYSLTGGVEGPVLFTSFERHNPLARVLDKIGDVFGGMLEGGGIHWLTLNDEERRDVAIQILKICPVLWIWDNVESVGGFPTGLKSDWSSEEQKELCDFLRDARDTKAKFLLTSRRDETGWLADLPVPIIVPPMPMQERVELARAIAERRGKRFMDVEDWMALLKFTQGNPLTITVLVGQALRDGLESKEDIEGFVAKLQAGTAEIEDDEREGRTKSLGASLRYGFEHAFDKDELKRLALLHLFQGFGDADGLGVMGNPELEWSLSEVRGLTKDYWISILDRAAEVGLLRAYGGGYYSVHPALPWYFKNLFEERYPSDERAARAFVGAVGSLGDYYHRKYEGGNVDVIAALTAEEPNLLHARRLAVQRGWLGQVIGPMQGLRQLYRHTGRRAEWRRLVEEIVPYFVDAETDGPIPGLEDKWILVTDYRVQLAREARQWDEAMRLQTVLVGFGRQRAADALARPPEELGDYDRSVIRTLSASLHGLGQIQREQGKAECVKSYEDSLELLERIGDKAGASACAFNLGLAYKDLSDIRDLDQSDRWFRISLKLAEELKDPLGQGRCWYSLGQGRCWYSLGQVAHERFEEARAAQKPPEELDRHLNDAHQSYLKALELFPQDAVFELATTHNALGTVFDDAGEIDQALAYSRNAIRYCEIMGDRYLAGMYRYNVASTLARAGRFSDALDYAQAALRDYETFGDRAAAEIQETKKLISNIQQAMKSEG
jgi:tetratricopeptide (TPR) repeat protein